MGLHVCIIGTEQLFCPGDSQLLDNREVRASVKEKVLALCAKYPVYQQA